MCNNCNNDNSCISEILQVILMLQENAGGCGDACLETCDRAFLGCGITCCSCNTRPIQLYTCCLGNTPLSFPISKTIGETITSSVFRIEKLDGNCATFRVLDVNEDNSLSSTNSFFTINLNCVCSLRCLNDTFIDSI